jgi:bifunctional N-acetylglucosamine-1-phosphate-uridyltransferase/glucosamine-1-phosphate-acetyltransferase GlmU-like protein
VVTEDVSDDALAIVRPPQVEKADWAKKFRLKNSDKKN